MKRGYQMAAGLAALLQAGTALAHSLGSHSAGFAADHAHPHLGLEHLLVIVVVGILVVTWLRCR